MYNAMSLTLGQNLAPDRPGQGLTCHTACRLRLEHEELLQADIALRLQQI